MKSRLLAYFALLPLLQCSPQTPPLDTLVIGIESNPTQLDPRLASDAYSIRIGSLLFDSLIRWDAEGNPFPLLAESWENPDPQTYIFHLRPNIDFHDGTTLSADDVVYTYQSMKNPQLHSPNLATLEVVESITATDPLTVVFRLKEPFAPFLRILELGIVPRHLAEEAPEQFQKRPIGSGPFQLEAWEPDDKIVLLANKKHFKNRPRLKRLIFRIVPDDGTRLLELRKGSIDLVQNAISPDALPLLAKSKHLRFIEQEGIRYSYLGMNLRDPILKDLRVRKAIAYAIDREEIIRYILGGHADLATGPLPPSNFAYTDQVQTFQKDVEKAKALLDEAEYFDPDGEGPLPRFTLSYKTTNLPLRRRIAEVLQLQLAQVGIQLKIRTYEWGTFFSDIRKGNFQLYTLTWTGISEPDTLYYIFHSSNVPPRGANRGFYKNSEVDRLLEEGRRTLDPQKRREIYHTVQKILAEELPYISLWYPHNIVVMNRSIVGFIPHPNGAFDSLVSVTKERRS